MNEIEIRSASPEDTSAISQLAERIWWQHYSSIITGEQISYMLARGYLVESLQLQMTAKSQTFLLGEADGVVMAYSAWSIKTDGKETWVYLNKLYAAQEAYGLGLGKALLDHVIDACRSRGILSIRLNVNKYNPTVEWYRRRGFTVRHEEVLDIGNGFVMDDYVMELKML